MSQNFTPKMLIGLDKFASVDLTLGLTKNLNRKVAW